MYCLGAACVSLTPCLANFCYLPAVVQHAVGEKEFSAAGLSRFSRAFSRLFSPLILRLRGQTPDTSQRRRIGQATVDALQQQRLATGLTGAKPCRPGAASGPLFRALQQVEARKVALRGQLCRSAASHAIRSGQRSRDRPEFSGIFQLLSFELLYIHSLLHSESLKPDPPTQNECTT